VTVPALPLGSFDTMARSSPRHLAPVRLAILTSEFNRDITERMINSARKEAAHLGAKVVRELEVPGIYDMPVVAQALLRRKDVDALVVLGAVITGETAHDELIAHATARTLQELSIAAGKPVGFGITGPGQTREQAVERIDRAAAAVQAAVKVVATLRTS
jgi:6,7-dimethyl-8-ribityllumazine synthase